MGSEHNVLRWNDFHTQIATNLQVLRDDDEFLDCTVACDENSQIQAHKLILSACSPYFRALFRKVSTPHPVVIMPTNVRFQEVVYLLDFMYHGEVTLPSEDVNQFLAVAEQFKIRGLYQERPKPIPPILPYRKGMPQPPKAVMPARPIQPTVPPDIRQRLPPGISMMKSGGASPMKRPRLDLPVHAPPDEREDDITEIPGDEEDSNDFYPPYGEDYEEGWDGEPPPPPIPTSAAASRGPQLMGLLCPNCRMMFHGVPSLKEHMAVCQGPSQTQSTAHPSQQGHFPGSQEEPSQLCNVCDKSFKSHRTLDNHMKKQHGISAPPKPPNFRSQAGRGKKQEGRLEGRMEGRMEARMEARIEGRMLEGDEGWVAPGFQPEPQPVHPKEAARPVGQVAPAQRSTTPKSEHDQPQRIAAPEDRRSLLSPRGGRGRGLPPMGRGGLARPGPSPGIPKPHPPPHAPPHPGPSHHGGDHGPPRPDLQKLGLKFGGQISITSTGNQGKKVMGGPVDGQGVSITKLKGDIPVGSPVNIRETGHKPDQGPPKQAADPNLIKTEPGQVKEEPKDFETDDMEEGLHREEGEEDFEEYGEEGEFEHDGLYQGDGDYEGMEGEEVEDEEGEEIIEGRGGMYEGEFEEGYPELGGDYNQD